MRKQELILIGISNKDLKKLFLNNPKLKMNQDNPNILYFEKKKWFK
jgi:hypothetical protein